MKRITLFILALILSACSVGGKSEYAKNLEKWQNAGMAHYRYTLNIACFCPFAQDMPLTVEVRDGEVVSITKADGSPVAPGDPAFEEYTRYATIDRIFSELKTNLDGAADEVKVTYNPSHGYPTQIDIDRIKNAIDDELYLTISNLEAVG